MTAPVIVAHDDGLVRITLNRPEASNAVTPALIDALAAGVAAARAPDARALLIEGAGRNFCAGADLRHFSRHLDAVDVELAAMATRFHAMLVDLVALPIPIVVAVQGNAVGAGFGLALVGDLILVADDARFSTGYARLGLSADAGTSYTLTRALGPRLAGSLLMTARFVDAGAAHSLGLIDRTVPKDALSAEANRAARAFADGPTAAYAAIKRLVEAAVSSPGLREQLDREEAEITQLSRHPRVAAAMSAMLSAP